MARLRYNFSQGVLGASLATANQGDVNVVTGLFTTAPGFSTLSGGDYIPLTIDKEVVWLTAYDSTSPLNGTLTRGQESTTPTTHGIGAEWVQSPTVADFTTWMANATGPPTTGTWIAGQSYVDSRAYEYICQQAGVGTAAGWRLLGAPFENEVESFVQVTVPTSASSLATSVFANLAVSVVCSGLDPVIVAGKVIGTNGSAGNAQAKYLQFSICDITNGVPVEVWREQYMDATANETTGQIQTIRYDSRPMTPQAGLKTFGLYVWQNGTALTGSPGLFPLALTNTAIWMGVRRG